jgi:quercetin dioxygenase-like cupin family protein
MIRQQSLVPAAAFGAALFATAAQAGRALQTKRADATKPATNPAKGVTDMVLSAIDLSKEPAAIDRRTLRLRKLIVQPGGVVPWHSHADRPAIIYIVDGAITE